MGDDDSGLRRVIRPEPRFIPYSAEQDEERSRLLSKMDALYREACSRIAEESDLASSLVSGVFVGLLDPVSNILASSTLYTSDPVRREHMDEAKLRQAVRRSLDGLVAFLLYFFPYLSGWEAIRYLLVADADLLAAARLVVADRGMTRFSITSPASAEAFAAALGLAAQVAGHPEPRRLVHAWMSMPDSFLASRTPISLPADLREAWDLAASRPTYSSNVATMPYEFTRSLRMALFDAFRCFYLRALARLPRHELRTRYHRSLLMAGHCYGPMDPVSNIILNTIWYDATFSGGERPVLDMIAPRSLTRLECRSFFGLASFIQTRYHNLSQHEITQCLVASSGYLSLADPNLDADAHLSLADMNLNGDGAVWDVEAARQRRQCMTSYSAINKLEQESPCTSTQEAYEAAATAAWHPNPEAQAAFLSSCKAMLPVSVTLQLQSGDPLTSEDVHYIASLLSPKQLTPEPVKKKNPSHVREDKRSSKAQERRITAKVKAALDRHLLRDGEPLYDLHIICGLNEFVGRHEYGEDKEDYLPCAPCTFPYSHVNFFVTPKGSSSHPILYFAELYNGEERDKPSVCCRVDVPTPFAEHVRCLYCEGEAAKIVHPASEKFHGREEFEDVISGRDSYTNGRLVSENKYAAEKISGLEEDSMYYDVKCIS